MSTKSSMLVCRAIDDPGTDRSTIQKVADIILVIVFTSEAFLKIIASGLVLGKKSYLRDAWNCLDFTVAMLGLFDLLLTAVTSTEQYNSRVILSLKVFRCTRVIRPLRLIRRAYRMRIAINSIIRCVKPCLSALGIAGSVFMVFAVLGASLYAGQFGYCQQAESTSLTMFGNNTRPVRNWLDCVGGASAQCTCMNIWRRELFMRAYDLQGWSVHQTSITWGLHSNSFSRSGLCNPASQPSTNAY